MENIHSFIYTIIYSNLKYKYGIYPAIKLIDTLKADLLDESLSKHSIFINTISGFKFITLRLYYDVKNIEIKPTNITSLLKEFIQPLKYDYVGLDFIFDYKQQLLGIVPLIFEDKNYSILKRNNFKNIDILYYDICELWIDMSKIQLSYSKRTSYIKKFGRKKASSKKYFKSILNIYIIIVYLKTTENQLISMNIIYKITD